jgi:predicted ATPase
MIYKKFTIKNFRCFSDEQSLSFAAPVAEKLGSGITYIVGANNSGKTTLIEGIWLTKNHKIKNSEKQLGKLPEFCLYDSADILKRKVHLIREESYTLVADPDITNNDELFEIISSRRHWDSPAGAIGTTKEVLVGTITGQTPRKTQTIATASILMKIEADPVRYKAFIDLVKRVIPEFTKWAVGYEENEYIEYISASGTKHKTDYLGDGVISVIRILTHLFEKNTTALIIDEPELSLHPLAQKRLIKLIAEYSQERQIIISTHSPYFVCWEYLANGAVLNRVAKTDDTSSRVHCLKDVTTYASLINGANWQQPFLMDEVAKEIFFANDNILFLEGQEDVGLLRNEFSNTEIYLFGYGVRGCNNFKFALTMAKDLGFQKVGAIIDNGTSEGTIFSELYANFTDYKVVQWNKNDIRDKVAMTSAAKSGYFNSDGSKKSVESLDDYDKKIAEIKAYYILHTSP